MYSNIKFNQVCIAKNEGISPQVSAFRAFKESLNHLIDYTTFLEIMNKRLLIFYSVINMFWFAETILSGCASVFPIFPWFVRPRNARKNNMLFHS